MEKVKWKPKEELKGQPHNLHLGIIRPTSIWGPWFGEPYDKFFHIVLKRMYFHMGEKACRKTYGYIDNVIYQIESILRASPEKSKSEYLLLR